LLPCRRPGQSRTASSPKAASGGRASPEYQRRRQEAIAAVNARYALLLVGAGPVRRLWLRLQRRRAIERELETLSPTDACFLTPESGLLESRHPMSSYLSNRAGDPPDQVQLYVAALLEALGERDPLEIMRAMPAALREALAGVSPEQLATPEAPGKWSMRQVVQHLSDSELVGGLRFRMVLAHDRPALAGYDQDLWVERLHRDDADLEVALAEFTASRQGNLRLLERTTPEDRERVAVHAERGEESLGHMMRLYAAHDLIHLRQLARIRQAVAPAHAAG
jgi:hypothetical protein